MLRAGAFVGMLVAALALSGCAEQPLASHPRPTATASSASTSAPTPDRTVAVLSISGTGVTAKNSGGTSLSSQPFNAGEAAMESFLTGILGAPTVDASAGGDVCLYTYKLVSWGPVNSGLEIHVPQSPNPPQIDWIVEARSATVNSIRVESSVGFSVGDVTDSIVSGLPAANKIGINDPHPGAGATTQFFTYDLVRTIQVNGQSQPKAYGGEAVSDAGKAELIFAPGTAVGGGEC